MEKVVCVCVVILHKRRLIEFILCWVLYSFYTTLLMLKLMCYVIVLFNAIINFVSN